MNMCAPLQGNSLENRKKALSIYCIYGFAYEFSSQW